MNFTYNNHITYTIGDRLFGYRTNSYENFQVSVGTIDHDHYRKSNYREELKRIADLVYNDYKKDFVVLLSGGTDSEIVARNFLEIGIKPKCYTIKFIDDYNISDVNVAMDLAKQLDLDLEIIDFDIKDFFYSGEASEFGKEIQCSQITYLMVYHAIRKIGLPAIMGGELLLRRNTRTTPSSWHYCLRENEDCSAMRFSLKYNIPLVNEWFSYTPEIMLYYLEDPDIMDLVSTPLNYKLASVSSKNRILKKLIPELKQRTKTHGFENLMAFNFIAYRQMAGEQIMRLTGNLDGIEYKELISILRGENGSN